MLYYKIIQSKYKIHLALYVFLCVKKNVYIISDNNALGLEKPTYLTITLTICSLSLLYTQSCSLQNI